MNSAWTTEHWATPRLRAIEKLLRDRSRVTPELR